MVLASMVWRRIFNKECNDPHKIELVVKYIRKQVMKKIYFHSIYTFGNLNLINITFYLFLTDVHSSITNV